MTRLDTFTFRVDDEERKMIIGLSNKLQRSQSDAVRWILREAFKQLEESVNSLQKGVSDDSNASHS